MTFEQIKQLDRQYILNTYGRYDMAATEGRGAVCTDPSGKQYIDFSSGIGVNSLGFCDPEWVAAVTGQLNKIQHISNLFYTEPGPLLAKTLCERTGLSKVFFGNSGAEANEGAIKAARKYSFDRYGEGRYEIISLSNSFHGRTLTTLTATGQAHFHQYFHPFTEGFVYADPFDIEDLKAKIGPRTCAVMVEFVQGEGGVVELEEGYLKELRALCDQHDLLMIADEVQTGIGRTGELYCFQHYDGLAPDILTSAKGLGGGLPIGAVLFNEKAAAALGAGDHGSTFGANPVVCAGANAVLKRMDRAFLDEVTRKGELIRSRLLSMPHVLSVSGKGMMIGAEIEGASSGEIVSACVPKGLLLLTAKKKVRLLPPLSITDEELNAGLDILEEVLGAIGR